MIFFVRRAKLPSELLTSYFKKNSLIALFNVAWGALLKLSGANKTIQCGVAHPTKAQFTFGLRCVYGARRLPVSPFPCGLRAETGGRREIFVRIHGHRSLYDFV